MTTTVVATTICFGLELLYFERLMVGLYKHECLTCYQDNPTPEEHAMIRVTFSTEIINNLEYERYHHPSPKVQKKMEVLFLKSQEMSHKQICQICRISKTTLAAYLKQYREGCLEGLKELHYKGRSSALNEHASSLEAYFKEHPPRTTAEAQAIIEEQTGIHRSPTQVRAFMQRIGMK